MTKEKTLSEQICELCGMKPRYKEPEVCNMRDFPGCLKANCKHYNQEQKICTCTPLSIDFENPENFVKLLELKTETDKTILNIISRRHIVSNRKQILLAILSKLHGGRACDFNNIKQSIRDYDGWVWG